MTAITGYIDTAQIVLYLFWAFFFGLVYWIRREDKREGYPLESDRSAHVTVQGFPAIPPPKTFLLRDGTTVQAPRSEAFEDVVNAAPVAVWPGAPLTPVGNPMGAGVGPGSYAKRAEVPDMTLDGRIKIVPMRADTHFSVVARDPDPRGQPAIGADGESGGTVVELWVDRTEPQIRYIEVETSNGNVLVPVGLARMGRDGIRVRSITGAQFAGVPKTRSPDQVTLREEDMISAYFGGGTLYAMPDRSEPLI